MVRRCVGRRGAACESCPRAGCRLGPGVLASEGQVRGLSGSWDGKPQSANRSELFGGVVPASPALARGPKWQFLPAAPFTLPAEFCGFQVQVTPQVNKRFEKLLKASDGSMILLHTGFLKIGRASCRERVKDAAWVVH